MGTTTDAAGKVKWRKVKHYLTGQQPTVVEGKDAQPILIEK